VKLSVSLPEEDVAFLDAFGRQHGVPSRSATLHRAVRLLQASQLEAAYEAAFDDWEAGGDAAAWAATVTDGLGA
jgi:Arc/MetJ-type ribon-helix-helix transcriptional regulator